MKKLFFVIGCVILCLINTSIFAEILNVDQTGTAYYSSIQEAINEASEGDIIKIGPDVYYEH